MTLADPSLTHGQTDSSRGGIDPSLASQTREMDQQWREQDQLERLPQQGNVSEGERMVSLASGAILALLGLGRRDLTGLLIAGVGGGLLYRGATGQCSMYQALGINTAAEDDAHPEKRTNQGTHVAQSFLINRSPQELYDYWRNFDNLPRIMSHLESVQVIDDRRSHWVAKAPAIAGGKVEWDAETTIDEPNSRIAWRSLPGADVDNAGSVQFIPALGDRGTIVRVVMDYRPPAGMLGKWVAKLSGEDPQVQVREDMRNFKRIMECGEVPTIVGQPRGTCTGTGKEESA